MVGSKCPANTIVHQLEVLVLEQLPAERESDKSLETSSHTGYHRVSAWVNIADFFGRQMVNMGLTLPVIATFGGDTLTALQIGRSPSCVFSPHKICSFGILHETLTNAKA